MVKMFIVVVVIFAVCWLPYHGYFIYTYHHSDVVKKPFIQHVYLVTKPIISCQRRTKRMGLFVFNQSSNFAELVKSIDLF